LLHFLVHSFAEAMNLNADDTHHVLFSKEGAELVHVRLVVEDFTFNLFAGNSAELSSASSVPHSNQECLTDFVASEGHDLVSNLNHGLIDSFWIASHFKSSILFNVSEATQHVLTRNSNLVKHQPAIVL